MPVSGNVHTVTEKPSKRKVGLSHPAVQQSVNVSVLKGRIGRIAGLQNNWDSYGAIAPSESVINNALRFIDCVMAEGYAITEDDIAPTPYGSIVFDFTSSKGLVSVEIGTDELGFFTEFNGQADSASDGITTGFLSIPTNLKLALEKLYETEGRVGSKGNISL